MELLAVITAISTVPKDSIINIYTDSQNVIDIATSQYQNKVIGKKFKQPNFILWKNFFELKKTLNLNINFHKVKAHTSDKWNNVADTLANEGRSEENILLDDKICNSNVTTTFFNINIDQHSTFC
jgi:ribonuclease HI